MLRPHSNVLEIGPALAIPLSEFSEHYIRASGPGGQHVNKASTAVQLRFDVVNSPSLHDATRKRLIQIAGNRLTRDGELVVTARRHRSREQNRRDAYRRIARFIARATVETKKRKRTRPSRAQRQHRLDDKRRRSTVKRLRGRPGQD